MAEKEYIDKQVALRHWPLCDEPADAYQYIKNCPAADVRPVVLCRDCKYWEYDVIFADGWCRGKHQGNPNWFCADGEKMEES